MWQGTFSRHGKVQGTEQWYQWEGQFAVPYKLLLGKYLFNEFWTLETSGKERGIWSGLI